MMWPGSQHSQRSHRRIKEDNGVPYRISAPPRLSVCLGVGPELVCQEALEAGGQMKDRETKRQRQRERER